MEVCISITALVIPQEVFTFTIGSKWMLANHESSMVIATEVRGFYIDSEVVTFN